MHLTSNKGRNASELKSDYVGVILMMNDDKRNWLGDLLTIYAPSKNLGAQIRSQK